jgi:hypothetical protein
MCVGFICLVKGEADDEVSDDEQDSSFTLMMNLLHRVIA